MELRLLELAEYAAFTDDRRLVISGIFNQITAARHADAPPGEPSVFAMPACSLIWIVDASVSEGLTHRVGLIVYGSDGEPVLEQPNLGAMDFHLNPHGRPLRFQGRLLLAGVPLPGEGDYVFTLLVDGKRLGETTLYVDEKPEGAA